MNSVGKHTDLRSGIDSMAQRDGKSHFQRGSIISLIRSVANMDHIKSNQSVLEERKSRAENIVPTISEDSIDIAVEV